jgi:hypothetical protein
LSAEEGAKADSVNLAVIDRIWNLKEQVLAEPGPDG